MEKENETQNEKKFKIICIRCPKWLRGFCKLFKKKDGEENAQEE